MNFLFAGVRLVDGRTRISVILWGVSFTVLYPGLSVYCCVHKIPKHQAAFIKTSQHKWGDDIYSGRYWDGIIDRRCRVRRVMSHMGDALPVQHGLVELF